MSAEWYVIVQGVERGPLAAADLRKLALAEVLRPSDRVRKGVEGRWVPAEKVVGLFDETRDSKSSPNPTAETTEKVPPVVAAPSPPRVPAARSYRTAYVAGASVALLVVVGCAVGFIVARFRTTPAEPQASSDDKAVHEKLASLQAELERLKKQAMDDKPNSANAATVSGEPQPVQPIAPPVRPPVAEEPKQVQAVQQVEKRAADPVPANLPANLADLIAKVEPSVVRIEVQGQDGGSTGSGFVADAKGWVATNYHVIEGAQKALVVFHDGRSVDVTGFLGVDPGKDLAILSIAENQPDVIPLALAAHDCRKGERVAALGAPKGLGFSVSDGVVSALRTAKEIQDSLRAQLGYDLDSRWVQTTAPISKGNSGGPLVNDAGEVVGLNTWYWPEDRNLSFAITAEHIRDLLAKCKVVQPLAALPPPRANAVAPDGPDALKLRVIARLSRLKETYEQQTAVAAQLGQTAAALQNTTTQLSVTQALYARIVSDGQAIQTTINAIQSQASPPSPQQLNQIQSLQLKYASLDAAAALAKKIAADASNQIDAANLAISSLQLQAAIIRLKWFELADPFGKLSRIEHQVAIAAHSEWIFSEGKNQSAYICRGLAYLHLGELDKSLADLTHAVLLGGPLQGYALSIRGSVLHAKGKQREGMADFGKALVLDKGDWLAYLARGIALCAEGRTQTAEKDFKAATSLSYDNPEPPRLMAKLFATLAQTNAQNGTKAVTNATRACELSKWQDWSCIDVLAAAYAQSGEFDKAVETAKRAAEMAPYDVRPGCLERAKLYENKQPLRDDWKSWYLAQ